MPEPIEIREEKPPLWGENLIKQIHSVRVAREALIEGILFKKSAQMKFAAEGIGKSTLSLQEAIQGTVEGNLVYGEFLVPKAFNTLYLQMERSEDEALERMKTMITNTPFDPARFVLDTSFQEFDFSKETHSNAALDRVGKIIKATFGHVDLIKLDPIYTMIPGGLNDDKGASAICNFSKRLQLKYDCSIDMIHHSNRGIKDTETGERKGKDMFGSGLFAWHCTGIYNITKTEHGTRLTKEKSSQSNLEKKIDLIFNHESQLSFVKNAQGKVTKTSVLDNYLAACKIQGKTTSFEQMEEVSGLSTSYLRVLQGGHLKDKLVVVGKTSSNGHLYKVL